jgi:hypothetical protein
MKRLLFLLVAILSVSTTYAAETQVRIGNRNATVVTDESSDSPMACHAALLESIKKQGWHDELYNDAANGRACLAFSQRVVEQGVCTKLRITFWKASKTADGKTRTKTQVFVVTKAELNSFLDTEIRPLFVQFSHAE